jgi:hypothetical protein
MGRLTHVDKKAATGTCIENQLDTFSYLPGTLNGCPYLDNSKALPGRWNGKQLQG